MGMAPTLKVAVVLLLLGLANSSRIIDDFSRCEKVVKKWASTSLKQEVRKDKERLKDLLFFLHVPRTGGRTYFHCILRKLYSKSDECPRSYDKLRFDPSKQKCRLLGTHDDYSMMSKLPKEKTSVVTILRDPVERVFSTYEFAIEVAARFLVHPNLTSAIRLTGRIRSRSNAVSTLDIWPWKYLVPWMREDLFARRDARVLYGITDTESDNPYNMDEMIMPLQQFINDPIAHGVVHNGETFQAKNLIASGPIALKQHLYNYYFYWHVQGNACENEYQAKMQKVAGLTNNSFSSEAHEVRHCVQKHKILGEDVLKVAKRRLEHMLYVGITENHKESAAMFANVVGAQVTSQESTSNSSMESAIDDRSSGTMQSSSISDSESETDDHQIGISDQKASEIASRENLKGKEERMTVEKLMETYESCITTLRKSQAKRRTDSLRRIAPANFSKQDRLLVSESVIEQIRELNNLDLELYKYGQFIFAEQQKQMMPRMVSIEGWGSFLDAMEGIALWKFLSLALSVFFLLLILFVFANVRRRTLKVKI